MYSRAARRWPTIGRTTGRHQTDAIRRTCFSILLISHMVCWLVQVVRCRFFLLSQPLCYILATLAPGGVSNPRSLFILGGSVPRYLYTGRHKVQHNSEGLCFYVWLHFLPCDCLRTYPYAIPCREVGCDRIDWNDSDDSHTTHQPVMGATARKKEQYYLEHMEK